MPLAEQPWLFCLSIAKHTTPCKLGLCKFVSIRRFFMVIAINPGITTGHQPAAYVLPLHMQRAHRAAVAVKCARCHRYALTQHMAFKRVLGLNTTCLANFWRINALKSNLQGFARASSLHPHRVAIHHMSNDARLRAPGRCQRLKGRQDRWGKQYEYY